MVKNDVKASIGFHPSFLNNSLVIPVNSVILEDIPRFDKGLTRVWNMIPLSRHLASISITSYVCGFNPEVSKS